MDRARITINATGESFEVDYAHSVQQDSGSGFPGETVTPQAHWHGVFSGAPLSLEIPDEGAPADFQPLPDGRETRIHITSAQPVDGAGVIGTFQGIGAPPD